MSCYSLGSFPTPLFNAVASNGTVATKSTLDNIVGGLSNHCKECGFQLLIWTWLWSFSRYTRTAFSACHNTWQCPADHSLSKRNTLWTKSLWNANLVLLLHIWWTENAPHWYEQRAVNKWNRSCIMPRTERNYGKCYELVYTFEKNNPKMTFWYAELVWTDQGEVFQSRGSFIFFRLFWKEEFSHKYVK